MWPFRTALVVAALAVIGYPVGLYLAHSSGYRQAVDETTAAFQASDKLRAEEAWRALLAERIQGLRALPPSGAATVGEGYLQSVSVAGDKVSVRFINSGKFAVKPNVLVCFYDQHGMATGSARISWVFQRLEPGQSETDSGLLVNSASSQPSRYFRYEFQ